VPSHRRRRLRRWPPIGALPFDRACTIGRANAARHKRAADPPLIRVDNMYRLLIWLKDAQNRLWVKPAIGSMVAVLVAALAALGNQLIPPGILPEIERETLDALLDVIASSMLVVATFSLSIMVSAFSSAAAGASPRATQLVASDESTQNAISSFISAFIYAIIANTALGLQLYGPEGRFILFVSTMLVLVFLIYTLAEMLSLKIEELDDDAMMIVQASVLGC
jgi:uncharacterized membrane protein